MLLGNIVQMQGCQVGNGQHIGRCGSKGDNYFEIALARLANLHPHFFVIRLRIQVTEGMVIFVSAIQALQAAKWPIGAALSATQMLDQIIFLQFAQYCAGAAYETESLVPLCCINQGG